MTKKLEMKDDGHDAERFQTLLKTVVNVPKSAITESHKTFGERSLKAAIEASGKARTPAPPPKRKESHEEFNERQIKSVIAASAKARTPPPPPRKKAKKS